MNVKVNPFVSIKSLFNDILGSGTPVNHIKSQIKVCIMTDTVKIPRNEIPPELYPILRIQQGQTAQRKTYLPLVYVDELSQRIRDLVVINSTDKSAVIEIKYEPISWGKLRLFLQFSNALRSMGDFGFKVRSDHINISVVLKGLTF